MLTPEDLIKITRGKAPWPYTPLELVRSRVTHAYPWMTTLIARLEVIEDLTIPLAATDGRRMWVNTPVLEKKGDLGFAFFPRNPALRVRALFARRTRWAEPSPR